MEELDKTREYAAERERRRQQPYQGEERRKRANAGQPATIRMHRSFR